MSRTARVARLALAFSLSAFSLSTRPAAAQDARPVTAGNAVYVELLGNGLLWSISYDRLLTPNVSARVGGGFTSATDADGDNLTLAIVPVTASYLWGSGNGRLETGLGVSLASASVSLNFTDEEVSTEGSDRTLLGTATVGYRYQRPDGGFVFRAGFTPVFSTDDFLPWFGVSFGYAF